jgi:hypothetical protein
MLVRGHAENDFAVALFEVAPPPEVHDETEQHRSNDCD